MKRIVHDFNSVFQPGVRERKGTLLILNNQSLSPSLVQLLWNQSSKRICADGGANWLFDNMPRSAIPNAIHGDLDSVRPEVLDFYKGSGSHIFQDKSQDEHDMEKCINKISEWGWESSVLYVAGVFGGRFDHEMANLNTAYRKRAIFSRIVLLSTDTVGEILEGGDVKHQLLVNSQCQGPLCALLPIFGPSQSVWSKGLRWNIDGRPMEFGGLVSSSNEVSSAEIEVSSESPLLFTTSCSVAELF